MGNKQSTEEGTTQTGFHPLTASRPPGSISVVLSNTAHPPIPPHLSREAEERRRVEEGKDLSSTVKDAGGSGAYDGGAATEHRAMVQEQGGGTAAPSQAPASSSSAAASEVAAEGATPNASPDKRGGGVADGAETPSNKLPATPDSVGKLDRSIAKFDGVLGKQIVALPDLRVLCWNGCPERHRATTWRLLLRYMPANIERREAMMARLRGEYADAVQKYFQCYDDKSASEYDRTMYNQIAVDLPRTNPGMNLFKNERVQLALHRILFVWGIRHPGTGYVQGINDLITPFIYVFLKDATGASLEEISSGEVMGRVSEEAFNEVEADAYHCMTNMLDNAQDNYVMDSKGIQEKVFVLQRIIERLDSKLAQHLQTHDVEFLQFSFRWFNCLLIRELSLPCSLRLWDTYVAEKGFATFHVYICAAVLLEFSKPIQTMDFPQIIVFLQNLPTDSWDANKMNVIVAQAYSWCQQWSTGHI